MNVLQTLPRAAAILLALAGRPVAQSEPAKPATAQVAGSETRAASRSANRRRPPALEIFRDQPYWPMMASYLLSSSRDAAERLREDRKRAEVAASGPESRSRKEAVASGASAMLGPKLSLPVQHTWRMAPVLAFLSHRLLLQKTWSSGDVDLAREIGQMLQILPGFPSLEFREQDQPWNLGQLEQLLDWFEDRTRQPAVLARMLATIDDGPFGGFIVEGAVRAAEVGRVPFGKDLELIVLKDTEDPEPMLLQMRRKAQTLWTRRVSGSPKGVVTDVTLPQVVPKRLDPHGWRIRLYATWAYGNERMDLFVDPRGEFLFYYLSW